MSCSCSCCLRHLIKDAHNEHFDCLRRMAAHVEEIKKISKEIKNPEFHRIIGRLEILLIEAAKNTRKSGQELLSAV